MFKKSLAAIGTIVLLAIVCSVALAQVSDGTEIVQKREHIVQKGQLSIDIVKKYGITLEQLEKLNPGRNIARLQIGDRLTVGITKVAQPTSAPAKKKSVPQTVTNEKPKHRPDKVVLMGSEEKDTVGAKKDNPGVLATAFRMLISLAIVLVLAYLAILALKLLSERRETTSRVHQTMKVVDTVRLSNSSSLHVVQVGGKLLLLGCSGGQINLLREFDQEESEEQVPVPVAKVGTFAEYLSKYSGTQFQNSPAGRLAGFLRDCATHLQDRKRKLTDVSSKNAGGKDEP
jgi:flagellar biogenesis protein FliO